MPLNLNISASINIFKLLIQPSLCLPHATVSTFNDLSVPIEKSFQDRKQSPAIKAVVLDKDDCFAAPDTNEIYPNYQVLAELWPSFYLFCNQKMKNS